MIQQGVLYDEIYTAEVVMARVGHLSRQTRQDVEKITRIIRESFDCGGVLEPKPRITKILLIGPYARRIWTADDETQAVPEYSFWIIVNDRLFTRKRLWQATEGRIAEVLEGRCTASLSFYSARYLRTALQTDDEFVVDQLKASIALFHARRDAPQGRRARSVGGWRDALAKFDAAETAFLPVCQAVREAERDHLAARAGRGGLRSDETVPAALAGAKAAERRTGDELHEALMTLLHTPAPDLAAVIRKLELVRDNGDGDDHATISILADLRWIAERIAACGRLP